MRICYLARANYPLLIRRAEMMASLGHDVHVVSLQNGVIQNCTVHHVKANSLLVALKLHFFTSLVNIKQTIEKIQPDIIDLHGATSYGFYTRAIKDVPMVMTIYGTELYSQANSMYPLRRVARTAIRQATLVYGSSNIIDKYIKEILGVNVEHKTKHHSWGISLDRISAHASERRNEIRKKYKVENSTKIIFHNRLIAPIWRIELIIEAIPEVLKNDENVQFWFAFAPPNKSSKKLLQKYQSRVKELGVEQWVRWLGSHAYDEFISLNHASDIYLNVGSHDLLASSVLEAMATGQVPILSDLSVYHEVIEHGTNGYFLESPTSSALANEIRQVLENYSDIQEKVASYNTNLIKTKYDEIAATKWLALQYKELIDHHQNDTEAVKS